MLRGITWHTEHRPCWCRYCAPIRRCVIHQHGPAADSTQLADTLAAPGLAGRRRCSRRAPRLGDFGRLASTAGPLVQYALVKAAHPRSAKVPGRQHLEDVHCGVEATCRRQQPPLLTFRGEPPACCGMLLQEITELSSVSPTPPCSVKRGRNSPPFRSCYFSP